MAQVSVNKQVQDQSQFLAYFFSLKNEVSVLRITAMRTLFWLLVLKWSLA